MQRVTNLKWIEAMGEADYTELIRIAYEKPMFTEEEKAYARQLIAERVQQCGTTERVQELRRQEFMKRYPYYEG